MIRCPKCKSSRLEVLGGAWDPTPEDHDYLRRRRRCKACRTTFHTREFTELSIKSDRPISKDHFAVRNAIYQLRHALKLLERK